MTKKKRKQKKKLQMRNKRLIKKYYWLMPRDWRGKIPKNYDYTWIEWGWSHGWDKAFGQMYMDELGAAINESGQKDFTILQIKEKYGCYDSETEVLTKNGWKYFKQLSYEDEIATLNHETNFLEYQYPTEIISERYTGQMYRLENRGISLCVTPNHNLYVAKGSDFRGVKGNFVKHYNDFELCNPYKYYGMDKRFLKTCKWDGLLKFDKYKIKGIEYDSPRKNNDGNSTLRHYIKEDLEFDLLSWLRFLGFYIAEGCVSNRKDKKRYGEINIAFNRYKEKEFVEKLITDIGFKPTFNLDSGYAIFYNQTLGMWLNDNCGHGAFNKKVPDFIKKLPSKYIEEFLKYLYIGDGHKTQTSNILCTISKQLSNDVQELLLKAGYCFRETERDRVGHFGGYTKDGYEIVTKHITYEINWLQLQDIEIDMSKAKKTKTFKEEWINYSGCVYCVTVPNHIIYIRRNGKGLWCGNSARLYCGGASAKVHRIIDKYEYISQNVCYWCGREAPMVGKSWITPECFDCYVKRWKRWKPNDDIEVIKNGYDEELCDKPDKNGEFHIPNSYTVNYLKDGGETQEVIDISDTVEKIRRRQAKWIKYGG